MKGMLAIIFSLVALLPVFGQYNNQNITPAQEKKNIQLLIQKQEKAKTAYTKQPKDAKIRKAYVESNVALGMQYTYSSTVDRKVKYKLALNHLREALKLEPKHPVAKPMFDQIVAIYKSMGKPVPGG